MSPVVEMRLEGAGPDEASVAFKVAIRDGRLSADAKDPIYAGNFMYMGMKAGKALFKHRDTREYLP